MDRQWVADLYAANEKKKKELRNGVLEETRAILNAGKYTTEAGATVELDTAGAAAGRTVFPDDHKFSNPPAPYNTTAHFVKADAIGKRPCLCLSTLVWVQLIFFFLS